MASVYIETTIPSCYFETRTSVKIVAWRELTRKWWDRHRHKYSLFTSHYVMQEFGVAPEVKAKQTMDLVKDVPILEAPPGLQDVAAYRKSSIAWKGEVP